LSYREVMLIRCLPSADATSAVCAALAAGGEGRRLLFFHGPGLAWAESETETLAAIPSEPGPVLMLCSAGWRRRHAHTPPPGWQLGSLVQFWHAADQAERVSSFGAGP